MKGAQRLAQSLYQQAVE